MILLDTHVCLWLLHDPNRIGPVARDTIRTEGPVHVSAVSVAELTIKTMTGRVALPDELYAELLASGLRPLPLRDSHSGALARFPQLARHDPLDRLLLAQASVEGLRFITADRVLLGLGLEWVTDAGV